MGFQCDTCRAFAPSTPAGWFVLARIDPSPYSALSALFSSGVPSQPEDPRTFCSPGCVADYAVVLAAAGSTGGAS